MPPVQLPDGRERGRAGYTRRPNTDRGSEAVLGPRVGARGVFRGGRRPTAVRSADTWACRDNLTSRAPSSHARLIYTGQTKRCEGVSRRPRWLDGGACRLEAVP